MVEEFFCEFNSVSSLCVFFQFIFDFSQQFDFVWIGGGFGGWVYVVGYFDDQEDDLGQDYEVYYLCDEIVIFDYWYFGCFYCYVVGG